MNVMVGVGIERHSQALERSSRAMVAISGGKEVIVSGLSSYVDTVCVGTVKFTGIVVVIVGI